MEIYYNEIEVSNASNIKINSLINGIGSANFQVPNNHLLADNSVYETWQSRIDGEEIVIKDGTHVLFRGYIKDVSGNSPLTITCEDNLGKLTWYTLPSENSDFTLFEGKINGVDGTSISVVDTDDNDPAFVDDQYNNKYVIVSDATINQSNVQLERDELDYIGYSETSSSYDTKTGDYTDVEDSITPADDDVYLEWERTTLGNGELGSGEKHYYQIGLALENYTIAKTSTIQKMEVKTQFTVKYYSARTIPPVTVRLISSADGDLNNKRTLQYFIATHGTVTENEYVKDYDFEIDVGASRQEWMFNKGTNYWEDGFIGVEISDPDTSAMMAESAFLRLYMKTLQVKIYYDTGTFDVINVPITDTTATDTLTTETNFTSSNVAVNDTVYIGETMNTAFNNIPVGSPVDLPTLFINNGEDIESGIAQQYVGISAYKMFTTLCDLNTYDYFIVNETTQDFIIALKEEDNELAGSTLTGFKPIKNVQTQNNKYGSIEVWWSGQSDGENPARVSTENDNPKTYTVMKKDILTYSEAMSVAQDLATKYTDFHYSIELEWNIFQELHVGYRYNFTIHGVEYLNQICRRVNIEYENGNYNIKGYFGGGHTPISEKIGMKIGELENRLTTIDSLALTRKYNPLLSSVNWSNILGRPSSYTPAGHHASHEVGGSDVIDVTEAMISDLDHYDSADFDTDFGTKSTTDLSEGTNLYYTDARVQTKIDAELVNGQSIDNAIDSLITTHTADNDAHHARYTDTEVESVITAELVDGQSIDNAIDSLITTHTSDNDAHHALVTSSSDIITVTGQDLNVVQSNISHDSIGGVSASDHHNPVTAGSTKISVSTQEIDVVPGNINHNDLGSIGASDHHVRYSDAEVESVINAELVDGQSIDNAIDSLISTHASVTETHGATGSIVGTTNTQTLTNKTLTAPTLNNATLNDIEVLNLKTGVKISSDDAFVEVDDLLKFKDQLAVGQPTDYGLTQSLLGEANGVATLDDDGRHKYSEYASWIQEGLFYLDNWDASTEAFPDPDDYTGSELVVDGQFINGTLFKVSVDGTGDFTDYLANHSIIWNNYRLEWDHITDSAVFAGYTVDCKELTSNSAIVKVLEVRGKRAWEIPYITNFYTEASLKVGTTYLGDYDDHKYVTQVTGSGAYGYLTDSVSGSDLRGDFYIKIPTFGSNKFTFNVNTSDPVGYEGRDFYLNFASNSWSLIEKDFVYPDWVYTTRDTYSSTNTANVWNLISWYIRQEGSDTQMDIYINQALALQYTISSYNLSNLLFGISVPDGATSYGAEFGSKNYDSRYVPFSLWDNVELGQFTLDDVTVESILDSGDAFSDDDDKLMTAAAIADKIEDYGYITDYTVTEGDVTAHESALSITKSQVSDFTHNNTSHSETYLTDYTVTEADVTAHEGALTISKSQVSDFSHGNEAHTSTFITGNQTITLSGDVSGTGTTAITCTVTNDSHTHDTRYFTETESDNRFLKLSGGTMSSYITRADSTAFWEKLSGYNVGLKWDTGTNYLELQGYTGVVLGRNGTTMATFTSAGAVITGKVFADNPKFRLTDCNSNIGTTSNTLTSWQNEQYDTGGNVSSGRFTSPVNSYYHFDASIMLESAVITYGKVIKLSLKKNGTEYVCLHRYTQPESRSMYLQLHGSCDLYLAQNDYVELYIEHTLGYAYNTNNSTLYNYFSGHMVI